MKPDLILFFDTETTGIDCRKDRIVEIAWVLCTSDGKIVREETRMIRPDGFSIPDEAARIHGITTEIALEEGSDLSSVLQEFMKDFSGAGLVVGHNVSFDLSLTEEECRRSQIECSVLRDSSQFCTMRGLKDFCKIPPVGPYPDYKFPKLSEAFLAVMGVDMIDAHDALVDTEACKELFFTALEKDIIRFDEGYPSVRVKVSR